MSTEVITTQPKAKKKRFAKVINPLVLLLFACAVLLTGLIAAIFGHKFGYYNGYQTSQKEFEVRLASQNLTPEAVNKMEKEVKSLNEQLESSKKERDISLNNLGKLRQEVDDLELKNLQLMQVNNFYEKSFIEQGGLPLSVVGAKIAPLPEKAFEYRFDVAMLAKDGKSHLLKPTLTLLNEDNLVEVPLEPSRYDIKGIARIRGRFVMPEGFKPKQAKLTLEAYGETVEQIYDWQFAEPVDEMPISLADIPKTDQRPVTQIEE